MRIESYYISFLFILKTDNYYKYQHFKAISYVCILLKPHTRFELYIQCTIIIFFVGRKFINKYPEKGDVPFSSGFWSIQSHEINILFR